jgi:phage terminase large subunit GpA-like protein
MTDTQLALAWLGAFAPPLAILPSVFAEAQIVLPSSSNAVPGALRLAPYQKELVDCIADDDVEIVVMQLSSQVGKSLSIDCQIGYVMSCAPSPSLHVSPTAQRSEEFVRDRLDPIINSSPALRKLVGTGQGTRKGSTGGANSLSSKSYPGGQINFASSHKPDELAARAIKNLWLDEVDRFAFSALSEGCPIALAIKRTKTFEGKGRKIVLVSTPTSRNASRINEWFLKGDQRRFMVKCTEQDCGHVGPLMFKSLHWKDGAPEAAFMSCDGCGVEINEAKRRELIENGEWIATAKGEPGVRSYHLSELSSKFSTLQSVATQAEAAKTPMQRQAFHNTTLAEVFDAGTEVELSSSELAARAEPIAPPYSPTIQFVTCGVDVQGNRLEVTALGHHTDGTFTVLNHIKLLGDSSSDQVWRDLDVVLGTTFPLSNGKILAVQATAIDAGFSADQVVKFVLAQRRKSRACFAVKGKSGFDQPALKWGGRLKGTFKLLLVGVDSVKHSLQKHLSMPVIGPGYIRLPNHLGEDYFNGLASESLQVKIVKGAPRYDYHRTYRFNEPLDCLVYSTAIAETIPKQALVPAPPGPDFKELARKLAAAHNNNHERTSHYD